MEERKTFLDYVGQVFLIFGITIAFLAVLCTVFGEDAKEYSSIFQLGKDGLAIVTILEYMLLVVLIVAARFLFFTDVLIKRWSVALRTACMMSIVVLMIVLAVICFDWFPVDMWQSWVMFILCFIISVGISIAITVLKEHQENRRMQEALLRLKEKE